MKANSSISRFFILFSFVANVCAFAAPPLLGATKPGEVPAELLDIFATDAHPGTGTVVFHQGEKVELVELGPQSGHYGLGIVFHSSALPEAFQEEFHDTHIIQIVLGTMASKLQSQVAQFGGISLITRKIPSQSQTFHTKPLTAQSHDILNLGLLMISSPSMLREQADEQKLKGTFFGESGTVILTPLAKFRSIQTETSGNPLHFKTQTMRLEFNSQLGTPFSNEKAELQGKLEIPIYWPEGKPAELFAKKIATRSLAGMSAPPSEPPTGITQHKHNLAGSTKKDANSKNPQ